MIEHGVKNQEFNFSGSAVKKSPGPGDKVDVSREWREDPVKGKI